MTTTIRIDDDLKRRVAAAAHRAGTTLHGFILDAIARAVEQAELENELHRVAAQRWANLTASGKTVSWEDSKAWLKDRARGGRARKPAARKV